MLSRFVSAQRARWFRLVDLRRARAGRAGRRQHAAVDRRQDFHGGGGVGKSYLIHAIAQWSEQNP